MKVKLLDEHAHKIQSELLIVEENNRILRNQLDDKLSLIDRSSILYHTQMPNTPSQIFQYNAALMKNDVKLRSYSNHDDIAKNVTTTTTLKISAEKISTTTISSATARTESIHLPMFFSSLNVMIITLICRGFSIGGKLVSNKINKKSW
jgi:hypothetical protein